jgi:hypothetical protein
MVGAFAAGRISGRVQPRRRHRRRLHGHPNLAHHLLYLVIELAAGALAGLAFRGLNPDDK